MYNVLIRNRLPVLYTPIYTALTGVAQQNIVSTLPTQVGLIYGLSIDVSATAPTGVTLITQAQSQLLFLSLKKGSSDFIDQMQLSNLLFVNNIGTNIGGFTNPYRFLPVNIPGDFSLDKSFYSNPTLITGVTIKLGLWYLTKEGRDFLINKGEIMKLNVK